MLLLVTYLVTAMRVANTLVNILLCENSKLWNWVRTIFNLKYMKGHILWLGRISHTCTTSIGGRKRKTSSQSSKPWLQLHLCDYWATTTHHSACRRHMPSPGDNPREGRTDLHATHIHFSVPPSPKHTGIKVTQVPGCASRRPKNSSLYVKIKSPLGRKDTGEENRVCSIGMLDLRARTWKGWWVGEREPKNLQWKIRTPHPISLPTQV